VGYDAGGAGGRGVNVGDIGHGGGPANVLGGNKGGDKGFGDGGRASCTEGCSEGIDDDGGGCKGGEVGYDGGDAGGGGVNESGGGGAGHGGGADGPSGGENGLGGNKEDNTGFSERGRAGGTGGCAGGFFAMRIEVDPLREPSRCGGVLLHDFELITMALWPLPLKTISPVATS